MRMEPLLFADENAPEWAFISVAKKRKGVNPRGEQNRFLFCSTFHYFVKKVDL